MFTALISVALSAAPAEAQAHDHHHRASPARISAQAQRELDTLARAVERYHDVRAAEADGWAPSPIGREDSPLMGEHWVRKDAREHQLGQPLDFTRPSNLQYARIGGRRKLVGVSFVVRIAPGDPPPEGFSGSADHWHVHDMERALQAATEKRPFLRWLANSWLDREYRSKGDDRSRLAMVHAWVTTPSPDGVFSMNNRAIPYLRVGLPASFAQGATESAALGVNLASEGGCANSLNGMLWIAGAERAQKRALEVVCVRAAARVRAVLPDRDKRAVNAAGEAAWAELEAARRATLSPDQLRRMAAITEHDPMSAGPGRDH